MGCGTVLHQPIPSPTILTHRLEHLLSEIGKPGIRTFDRKPPREPAPHSISPTSLSALRHRDPHRKNRLRIFETFGLLFESVCALAAHVLPRHLVPAISTAPKIRMHRVRPAYPQCTGNILLAGLAHHALPLPAVEFCANRYALPSFPCFAFGGNAARRGDPAGSPPIRGIAKEFSPHLISTPGQRPTQSNPRAHARATAEEPAAMRRPSSRSRSGRYPVQYRSAVITTGTCRKPAACNCGMTSGCSSMLISRNSAPMRSS